MNNGTLYLKLSASCCSSFFASAEFKAKCKKLFSIRKPHTSLQNFTIKVNNRAVFWHNVTLVHSSVRCPNVFSKADLSQEKKKKTQEMEKDELMLPSGNWGHLHALGQVRSWDFTTWSQGNVFTLKAKHKGLIKKFKKKGRKGSHSAIIFLKRTRYYWLHLAVGKIQLQFWSLSMGI